MNKIKIWLIGGSIFTILFGTILHFFYDWLGENAIVGIFSSVNESVWEHLKLLFWPLVFYSLVEYVYIGEKYENYLFAKAVSIYSGIILIITLFYTYSGVLGKHILFIDILIFIVSVIASQYITFLILSSDKCQSKIWNYVSLIGIIVLMCLFVVFTFNPPHIPLFEDSRTGTYGR